MSSNPLSIRLPKPLLSDIDAEVASRRDGADRGQVIRELLVRGLQALEEERKILAMKAKK